MWSTIAALKGILRVRQSETKWRLFGFLKRVSTSEHGIAGHDRLALSVRSWSSCSIAAMRRLKSENLETEITSARIDRSARSLTDSDSAPAASLAFWSDARWARIAIRPSARSRARRPHDSTVGRSVGWLCHR